MNHHTENMSQHYSKLEARLERIHTCGPLGRPMRNTCLQLTNLQFYSRLQAEKINKRETENAVKVPASRLSASQRTCRTA